MAVNPEMVGIRPMDQWECPQCMGIGYTLKTVEIPVTVGDNTVLVTLQAAECDQCGNQLIDGDNAAILDAAYDRLEAGDTSSWVPVGTVYRQPADANQPPPAGSEGNDG